MNQQLKWLKIKCPLELPDFMCSSCFFNGGYHCTYPEFQENMRNEGKPLVQAGGIPPGIEFQKV